MPKFVGRIIILVATLVTQVLILAVMNSATVNDGTQIVLGTGIVAMAIAVLAIQYYSAGISFTVVAPSFVLVAFASGLTAIIFSLTALAVPATFVALVAFAFTLADDRFPATFDQKGVFFVAAATYEVCMMIGLYLVM